MGLKTEQQGRMECNHTTSFFIYGSRFACRVFKNMDQKMEREEMTEWTPMTFFMHGCRPP
ncbi:hypothetical protein C0J52_03358 [Blattella germanica]|nr:hypothetical protein C0J52_03358 [Blattella germanica]